MDLKDALTIVFERFNAAVILWNFQIAVLLGLIAFLAAASDALHSKWLLGGLTGAYVAFASINLAVLEQVESQRRVLATFVILKLKGSELQDLGRYIPGPSFARTMTIHLIGDFAAVCAIWLVPYFSRKRPRSG